jgi:(2Fe-2S) ferredoxin
VLQDVDRRVVRVVSQHVAKGERVDVNVFRLKSE